MDFSRFDSLIDFDALAADVKNAKENSKFNAVEVPNGVYNAKVDKMELGETKDGRPMFKIQFRILDGEFKKHCLFMNRVIYGTKNDANMIASVIGILDSLKPSDIVGELTFASYSQFSELILDVMEDIDGEVTYEIEYDKDAFNSVSIKRAIFK